MDLMACGPAIVDFPTPPFGDDTAITFLTSLMLRRSGSPRCMRGILPVRGNPLEVLVQLPRIT